MTKQEYSLASRIRRFASDQSGNVVVVSALTLPFLLGFVGLSVEYGNGLLTQVENQRVADLASYAGAVAYSETRSEDAMIAAAQRIAALNGVAAADLSVALTTSPRGSGDSAVRASVETKNNLVLAPLVGGSAELAISAVAYAVLGGTEQGGCIYALDPNGSGIEVGGGGMKISAPSCTVATNASITVPCGATIQAGAVTFGGTNNDICPWGNAGYQPIVDEDEQPETPVQATVVDPLADSTTVEQLADHVATVRAQAAPLAPSVAAGADIRFSDPVEDVIAAIVTAGCAVSNEAEVLANPYGNKDWVIQCGPVANIGAVKMVGGNSTAEFVSAGTGTTYNISGTIEASNGNELNFDDGTFNIAGGVIGGRVHFGRGTFRIGSLPNGDWSYSCGSWPISGWYSLCVGGADQEITFEGGSVFEIAAGVYSSGNAVVRLGTGSDENSYAIGPSSAGAAIGMGGSGTVIMADAVGSDDTFRVSGNIVGDGGSCVVFPAAEQHDIAGNVTLGGTAQLGSGVYTVDGYVSAGAGSSSDNAYCGGAVIQGEDVTLVISGVETPGTWDCSAAFCIGGGNAVRLTAPKTGDNANLAVIGPLEDGVTAGAEFSGSGSAYVSGAFYFPQGKINMGGGGKVAEAPGGCLQLIGASIKVSGGGATGSSCLTSESGSGKVGLVQ